MAIHLAVVEDDPLFARQVQEHMKRYQAETGTQIDVRFFSDGEDIIENYKAEHDIILMDIQMRFMDGMMAARLIREKDEKVIIMFLTSMSNYALQGYEVNALDFIVKPVDYRTLSQKLTRAIKRLQREEEHHLLILVGDGVKKVAASQIYYIESDHHRMTYHTAAGVWEAKGRLDDLEEELTPHGFFRSNKGYLVNMYHVQGVADGCCLIAGDKLLISRRKKAAFMEQLAKTL